MRIHSGLAWLASWGGEWDSGSLSEDESGKLSDSCVVRVIRGAVFCAKMIGNECFLVLDRAFLSIEALLEAQRAKGSLVIVTRAKGNCVAWEEPVPTPNKKGRPAIRGEKVKLMELFNTKSEEFAEATVHIYGKLEKVKYCSKDLLWRQGHYIKTRFVLVLRESGSKVILVCTGMETSPEEIMELYGIRYKTEISFRELKQTLAGLSSRFWPKAMPKRARRKSNEENSSIVAEVSERGSRESIMAAMRATEAYAQLSCIALGLLQMLALAFAKSKVQFRWLRTKSNIAPSEATIADYLKKPYYADFERISHLALRGIIAGKQEWLESAIDSTWADSAA